MAQTSIPLFQNHPNPFNESTTITYQIPEGHTTAKIIIYDLQGGQIKSYALEGENNGLLEIRAGTLKPGIYHYALIVSNEVIDIKKMILTK